MSREERGGSEEGLNLLLGGWVSSRMGRSGLLVPLTSLSNLSLPGDCTEEEGITGGTSSAIDNLCHNGAICLEDILPSSLSLLESEPNPKVETPFPDPSTLEARSLGGSGRLLFESSLSCKGIAPNSSLSARGREFLYGLEDISCLCLSGIESLTLNANDCRSDTSVILVA
jgi:hypothetical protein